MRWIANVSRRPVPGLIALAMALALAAGCGPQSASQSSLAPPPDSEPPRAQVSGRVTLDGAPDSSGTQVFVPGSSVLSMTDSQGNYKITGLGEGIHVVMAQKAGYESKRLAEIEITADSERDHYVLPQAALDSLAAMTAPSGQTETRTLGSIEGKVILPEDLPDGLRASLPEGRIELEGTPMRTFAREDGSFYLWNVEPGDYSLLVRYPGFLPARQQARVEAGPPPSRIEIPLNYERQAEGDREIVGALELFDPNGDPSNAFDTVTIGLRELPRIKVRIEPDGVFHIHRLSARIYTLFAEAEDFLPAEDLAVDCALTTMTRVKLMLAGKPPEPVKPGSIVGVAIKNNPAERDMKGISVALAGTTIVAITDTEGNYRMRDVPPGTYQLVAQAEGYETETVEKVEVAEEKELRLETIYLEQVLEYPLVIETSPGEGTSNLQIEREMILTARFNKKMKPESLREAVRIEPRVEHTVHTGREHRLSDYDVMVIVINGASKEAPVPFDTAFRMTIAAGVEDVQGLGMREPFVLSFRSGKAAIIGTDPPDGSKEAVLNPALPLRIVFNAPIDAESVDPRDLRIRPSLGQMPTIQVVDDPSTGWSSILIQSSWKPGTSYDVTVPRRVKTSTGKFVSNTPYTFKFKTVEAMSGPELGARKR